MCLNLFLFLTSPLEQFEISSFTSQLKILTTYNFEFVETTYSNQNLIHINQFLLNCIFFGLIIFQNFYSIKGILLTLIGIYLLTISINIFAFNDIYKYTLNFEQNYLIWEYLIFQDFLNKNNFPINTLSLNIITEYVTTFTSYINFYSVLFCFIYTYCIIYLIYNKMLSSHTNTLIPTLYQNLSENLYKISLNLFYSILGKNINIPEFFIKINTIFIFLIISNIQGMIPYMSTLTSALTNTFFIALGLFISIITTLLDKKGFNYFLNLFMPSGCPLLLSLLIIPIELISYSFRLVSLSVRLFANMMAGHTLLKVIVGFSWVIIFIGNTSIINLFPILILFILTLLEFGVALIQAYIFTVLSCIYLRDIFEGH